MTRAFGELTARAYGVIIIPKPVEFHSH